jgi:Transposase IS4
MAPDLQKVIGTSVMCKATHITHITECNCPYGLSAKTTMLDGVVVKVHVERNNPTNRSQTYVTGDWELGNGQTKRVKVSIRLISLKSITINELTPKNNTNNIAPAASSPEDNIIINANKPNNEEEPIAEVIQEAVVDNLIVDTTLEQLEQLVNDSDDETVDLTLDIIPVVQPPPTPPTPPVIAVNNIDLPITIAHDRLWYPYQHSIGSSINGMAPYRKWGVRLPMGGVWREGCNSDETISCLDVFLQMFPVCQLNDMMLFTNQQLQKKNYRDTTKTELLKFLGALILCTRYEWNNRLDLWAETANS